MRIMPSLLGSVLLVSVIASCAQDVDLEGRWMVTRVTVGEEEMTPNARWMEFRADGSQVSGNGWLQHSYGSWKFDETERELSVVDSNGTNDPNGPFLVEVTEDGMIWQRQEEGMPVTVSLERADKLPETYGDKLIGLWQLTEMVGNGKYFDVPDAGPPMGIIFFRWDRRFMIGTPEGRIHGVYNVHGHRPEVELIPYGDDWERDFWSIEYGENTITLTLLNSETEVVRRFVRIYEFPM